MPAVLEKSTTLSAIARPRRNRISFRVPDNLTGFDFRIFVIPVERTVEPAVDTDLLRRLDLLSGRYDVPNWDGYGAKPLSPSSLSHARAFSDAIPASFSTPDVGVDADGEVTFEWYHAPDNQCSLTFSTAGKVYCIVRTPKERLSATIPIDAQDHIIDLIEEVANA